MRKTKHWLMTIAALLCSLAASAHDFEVGGIYYNITSSSDLTVAVTFKGDSYYSYSNEYSGIITIPTTVTYEGIQYRVTSIGDYAFNGCSSLTSITIPENVTRIGERAFYDCRSLTIITLPESVTSIGERAFVGCASLTAITLPKSMTSIGNYVFSGCTGLTAITIPENVTRIGNYAFNGCNSLTSITLPESVTSIGDYAFTMCDRLYKVINYSNLPLSAGSKDYGYVANYAKKVYQGGGLATVDDFQFYTSNGIHYLVNYIGNDTEIVLPNNYNGESYIIGDYAFCYCSSLTAITLPEGVTSIGLYAFFSCSSLEAITLSEGVKSIGQSAFSNCSNLTTITFPEGVTNIGYYAFFGCSKLIDVYCYAEEVPTTHTYAFNSSNIGNATLHVLANALNAYKNTAPWSSFGKIETIKIAVTSITLSQSSATLLEGASLTLTATVAPDNATDNSVTWSSSNPSVATVDNTGKVTAFAIGTATITATANDDSGVDAQCVVTVASTAKVDIDGIRYNLISKAKQAEVTNSGNYSGSITIPATVTYNGVVYSVTSIGDKAFYYCSSLTSITIPESVTSIGNEACYDCYDLTTINIPEGVTNIGERTFYQCESLTTITIPENVTSIGEYAFYNCQSLTAITFPKESRLTSIGEYAFRNCDHLTIITLPGSVTSIGYEAFAGCSRLTTITIPKNVTSIGNYAFYGCTSLTTITLPESVTKIGWYTFNGCTSLTAITLPESVTKIEGYAFYQCTSLTTITIPENSMLTSIGDKAFYNCRSLPTVVLPKSVSSIGSESFANCPGLTDVYCLAETMPSTKTDAFNGSYPEFATLYVPAVALNDYKSTAPWSSFGTINSATNEPIQSITLSQSSATLLVEESLTLTATVAPDNATDNSVTWSSSNPSVATVDNMGKVMAIAPGTATITATANDGSGVSAQCEVTVTKTAKVEIDGIWYNLISKDKVAEVTYKGEYSGSITIPATVTYGGVAYSVTSIGDYAFSDCSSLTAITLPESLTSIGSSAFKFCQSLTAINIPEGVTSIGEYTFYYCSSLTAIILPEGVTSIGWYTFSDCRSLTDITIPASVTSIGGYAFKGCSSLAAITLPEGVTSIGDGAFGVCTSLTAITLPEGVTSIGGWAFYGCSSLTAVHISNIEAWCKIEFGDTYSNPLFYAHNLYLNGELVTNLVIPDGVTSIGERAFDYCSSLTTIVLPKSVDYIYGNAFANCPELLDVYCYAESVPTTEADAFEESYPGKATLHVPASAINDYKATAPWSEFGSIVALTEEGTAPTEVTITINQYGSGTYCSEYALDFSNVEGLKAYAATGFDSETGVVTLTRVMTSQPGMGLFIKGEPGEYTVPTLESTSFNTLNMLVGTLEKISLNSTSADGLYTNYKYTIKAGDAEPMFYRYTDGSTCSAGKAYLQIPTAWLPQTTEARSIRFRFDEGEGTTDIEQSTIDNSQLTITYDLYGRRVDNPVKGGIYIVNGKKVIVK